MHAIALRLAERIETRLDPASADDAAHLDVFRAYAHEVLPQGVGDTLERESRFPTEELREFARRGLMESFLPAEANGRADWSLGIRIAVRFSAYEPDVLLCMGGTALGSLPIYAAGTLAQKRILTHSVRAGNMAAFALSEWAHGLDILGNDAQAQPLAADGHPCAPAAAVMFRLSGTKAPVNNASQGDIVTVLVRTGAGREAGTQSLFMVRRADVVRQGPKFESLGYRCMDLSSIVLDGITLPRTALLGNLGEGFHHARRALEISRGGVAAMAAGLQVRALSIACTHARDRYLYDAPVTHLPAVRQLVAYCYARVVLGLALARFTARLLAHATVSARHVTCAAKLVIPQLLERTVHDCGTILGARSLMDSEPFARLRRTAPVYAVFDGSTLLQKEELWRCLITWRAPASLDAANVLEKVNVVCTNARAFNPYSDDAELAESLTPPVILYAAAETLAVPELAWLARAAGNLVALAPSLRRGEALARTTASDCAGALYALAALTAFVMHAAAAERPALAPVVRYWAATTIHILRSGFDLIGAELPPLPANAAFARVDGAALEALAVQAMADVSAAAAHPA